jgi:glutamyl-tRNA reductase
MKPHPNESIESWSERVRMFEHGRAMQRIAQGEDINLVMEDMARRITDKMLHPIYKALHTAEPIDLAESRKSYIEKMSRIGPSADHVEGQLFDKTE